MLRILAALAVLAGLSVTAASAADLRPRRLTVEPPKVHTIRGDRGGVVIDYAIRVQKLRRAGGYVKFAGRCDSACTLFLSMPKSKTCIAPGAQFGFHLPYGVSERGNRVAARYLMKNYPTWVRAWIQRNGGLRSQIRTMTYAEASRHMPTCASPAPKFRLANLGSHRSAWGFAAGR
jgi:hypothetical protein